MSDRRLTCLPAQMTDVHEIIANLAKIEAIQAQLSDMSRCVVLTQSSTFKVLVPFFQIPTPPGTTLQHLADLHFQ